MKRLSINILVFFVGVMLPLFALDKIVNNGLRVSKITGGNLNEIYAGNINADVLIMGPSRAKFMYSPKEIDSAAGCNSYNIGINGWPVHMEVAMYRLYTQHNKKPKYIIYNIGWGIMVNRHDFYDYEQFMPYANDSIVLEYTKNLDGAFSISERYFPLFIYNNHFDYILEGIKCNLKFGKRATNNNYRGYKPNIGTWNGDEFESVKKTQPELLNFEKNDTTIAEFKQFLQETYKDGIKVIFVYAPTYFEATALMKNRPEMLRFFEDCAQPYGIPILDYSMDSLCKDKKYFRDAQHLNDYGSAIFSSRFGADVRKYLTPNSQ